MYLSNTSQFYKMRLIKQTEQLNVVNLDKVISNNNNGFRRHGNLLPSTIRCILCGPSSAGKTNVMLSMLYNRMGLRFENLYIYSKSLYQPKYQCLETILSNVPEVNYFPYKENDDIIDPENAKCNSVFIFDDVSCDKQNKIKSYFCMGRHKLVDSFYLCQSYTHCGKHLVRDNANLLIIFKQDDLNLRHIYDDHVGTADMSFTQFKEICAECWRKDKYGFLVIDKDRDIDKGRYRKKFDYYICV